MNQFRSSPVCTYKKVQKWSIDLSLLRQGFHIPPEFHALVYAALGRKLHHGEGCEGLCFEFANDVREAVYDFSYQTAVLVTENKSPRGERATAEAIANGFLTEEDLQKRSEKGADLTIFEGKPSQNRQIWRKMIKDHQKNRQI